MLVKFGEFEEVEKPDEIKSYLRSYFERITSNKYKTIYIAYPHQSFSEEYQPEIDKEETLQLYIFSIPSTINAEPSRFDLFNFNDIPYSLSSGQRDVLKVTGALPKGYTKITDEKNQTFALSKDNKIWILNDLFHNFKVESTSTGAITSSTPINTMETLLEPFLVWLKETAISPLTPEEIKAKLLTKIEVMLNSTFKVEMTKVKERIKANRNEVKNQETRLVDLIRTLSRDEHILKTYESAPKKTPSQIIDKVMSMPFVKEIHFVSGQIVIDSNPVSVGPFNYGSWQVFINNDHVEIEHENKGSVLHPYEYEDHHFCFGGFNNEIYRSLEEGDLANIVSLCRMEITNYATSTKMHEIEPFLKKTTGAKTFNQEMEKIRATHLPNCDNVNISAVDGKKFTFIGLKNVDGRTIPTASKVEINYDQ